MERGGHWADITASKIIRERQGREVYVCASGITPSGTVHIGNFREIISVELVVRALRERGVKVRFICSWDDYDVFRRVPKNMPEGLETYLRRPITSVPDMEGGQKSYAAGKEAELESILPLVGIEPEYIYQTERYKAGCYAENIKLALDGRDAIRRVLNSFRSEKLDNNWYPLRVFCGQCERDTTRVLGRPTDYEISYECGACGNKEGVDLRRFGGIKLPWRIDWPMRWCFDGVDFEPAGKDHHSEGGSFDTARLIAEEVFNYTAPVTFQYDFVRIKGRGGKISSSEGQVLPLSEVLEYYQPELVRFMFAGTRPNSEFAISFDLDAIKIYEDYDRIERDYFDKPQKPGAKWYRKARIYELSQVGAVPARQPYQISFRHLTTLLQIYSGAVNKVIAFLGNVPAEDRDGFRVRATCAWNWLNNHAPENFRFNLRRPSDGPIDLPDASANLLNALGNLKTLVKTKLGRVPEKEFEAAMYDVIRRHKLDSREFFASLYLVLIAKREGPRMLGFLHTLGAESVSELLELIPDKSRQSNYHI